MNAQEGASVDRPRVNTQEDAGNDELAHHERNEEDQERNGQVNEGPSQIAASTSGLGEMVAEE